MTTSTTAARGPFFAAWRGFDRRSVSGDLVAGLTLWAVVVPEALAYAAIAGVPPVTGLYAVVPAAVLYAVFGSSRHLVVGPMSATAALSAAAVAPLAKSGLDIGALTAATAIVTGLVAIVAGVLRLGFVAGFISEPVLKGFIIGMALTIIIGQVPKLFGIDKGEGDFFVKTWDVIRSLGHTKPVTLAVGLASLAALIALKRFAPRVPGSLVVVLLAIGAVHVLHLDDDGLAIVGQIQAGLPHLGIPQVPFNDYVTLLASGAGIAVVGFAEGLGAAKEYAAKNGYEIDANRELLGLGFANLGAGLASGMVVNGSLSKTAVNGQSGARSQVSGLTAAAMTLLTLLFLTPLFQELPEATLAAVVIVAVIELVDVRSMRTFYELWDKRLGTVYGRSARADFIAAAFALTGVLVFDTLPGLVIGVLVSLLLLVYRASKPYLARLGQESGMWVDVRRHPHAVEESGVCVARVEGALFFADSDTVHAGLLALLREGERGLVLDAGTVPMVDLTAARMLHELAGQLAARDVRFIVASPHGPVRDFVALAEGERRPFEEAATIDEAVARLTA